MPTFENYLASPVVKMIYLGDTGAGKTGSLASLAASGYNVRILDLDKGVEVLNDYLRSTKSIYTKANPPWWTAEQASGIIKRISYVQLDESMIVERAGSKTNLIPKGDLWGKIADQLGEWKDGDENLGNIGTWTPDDVLVIDGMSRLAQSAFNFQLKINGRLTQAPHQSDYKMSQDMVERMLMMLYSSEVKCNVIVICHIALIDSDNGPTRGFPQTIGKALSPKVGQYFNHALLARASASGDKRVILTSTGGIVNLKSAAPLKVKAEYDLATGLAQYFADLKKLEEQAKRA